MKPSLDQIRTWCLQVPKERILLHLERLGKSYFQTFDLPTVALHIHGLSRLSSDHPCEVFFGETKEALLTCTILAFDYPSEFSLITGTLAGTGFSIFSGHVFTYRREGSEPLSRRYIIDQFAGNLEAGVDREVWKKTFTQRLREILSLLERGKDECVMEAKNKVNEAVAAQLARLHRRDSRVLFPVDIQIQNDGSPYTSLKVVSQDTPAFLYALSNALSFAGISIERVKIKTENGRVEDEMKVQDQRGYPMLDSKRLDQLRFSVLLVKQFTYFLEQAPDPFTALSRFERLCQDISQIPDKGVWLRLFSRPESLETLALILGISDFIWEDFVRTQYESLIPLLDSDVRKQRLSFSMEALEERMATAMTGASTMEEKQDALNRWKDHESFSIDLDHIVHAQANVRALAEPLCRLSEVVVRKAMSTVFQDLTKRYGVPRTVAGLEARVAAFGLGKFGGMAMGYASDIELLFVYSDHGSTDGENSIPNGEFFERLVEGICRFIHAKREGIFQVDLRLRPHGNSGPKACSLTGFCQYYGQGGQAQSFECLALTRLRAVAGDSDLGRQVERLRDEFVYETSWFHLEEFQRLRERQLQEKSGLSTCNVKFSPGALVDLEYSVQILQVRHGRSHSELRTPRIHEALAALSQVKVLESEDVASLERAYEFFRLLINGLRMLRGNALDLNLPSQNSQEFVHLARRVGYGRDNSIDVGKQLFLDFEMHSAVVRSFIERQFGSQSLPLASCGNAADLLLSENLSEELKNHVLSKAGFMEIDRALLNLRRLAGGEHRREEFLRLAVMACDQLARGADPDMALNNWERFVSVLPDPRNHFRELLSQPRRLEILLDIFASSQFLADTLFRYPSFLDWVTDAAVLHGKRDVSLLHEELCAFSRNLERHEWLNWLRRFRRRELIRIGTRDLCLRLSLDQITRDLSALAQALLMAVVGREEGALEAKDRFCVLALGKLGGEELNYSSDIDLLVVCQEEGLSPKEREGMRLAWSRQVEALRKDLSDHMEEGYLYRVDFRLRPHGSSGDLLVPWSTFCSYYGARAPLWEVQALLKLRWIAGSMELGERIHAVTRDILCRPRSSDQVKATVREMRERAVKAYPWKAERNVKTGLGGIREVEFLVQGLQLIHLSQFPELLSGNTLDALKLLKSRGLLPEAEADQLAEDYCFMRRVEHCLQILADRQIHEIPRDEDQMRFLARRVLGRDASLLVFQAQLREAQERIHASYEACLANHS